MVVSLMLILASCNASPQITLQDYLELQAERDALAAEVERLTAEAEAHSGGVGAVGGGVDATAPAAPQPAEDSAAQVGGELDGRWEALNPTATLVIIYQFQGNSFNSHARVLETGAGVVGENGTFSISGNLIEFISVNDNASTREFWRIDENTILIDSMEFIRVSNGGSAAPGVAAPAPPSAAPAAPQAPAPSGGELDGTWVGTQVYSLLTTSESARQVIEFQGNRFDSYSRVTQTGRRFNETSGTFSLSGDQIEFIHDSGRIEAVNFSRTENTFTMGRNQFTRES